jgi:hypothetical protein
MPVPPYPLLNHPQREHLSILLAHMEDALDKVERAAESRHPSRQHLTVVADDLPPDFAQEAQAVIAALRNQIVRLARDFNLSSRRLSLARAVGATITSQLVRVEDSYSRNLHGYGAVAPELAAVLDPALGELHDGWILINRALTHGSPATQPVIAPLVDRNQ